MRFDGETGVTSTWGEGKDETGVDDILGGSALRVRLILMSVCRSYAI